MTRLTKSLLAAFIVFPALSFGQVSTLEADIDELLTSKGFSGTVLIDHYGSVIYHNSFGLANRQFDVPNTNETRYHIASVTKLFTSVLVFQLYYAGRIELNKRIKDVISLIPEWSVGAYSGAT